MNKIVLVTVVIVLSFLSCQPDKPNYLRWVGDIEHNTQMDDINFKVCNGDEQVFQYFNLGEGPVYSGEKSNILNTFKSNFKQVADNDENGLIRIRFIVNCEGKAGRFRVLQSDYNYQEKEFNNEITSQLLNITKQIDNWKILYNNEKPVDYYMYLIFKITDGQLIEILP